MSDTAAILLLPRLRVQNANAVSGPLTWGFPAPTAFTGFVHALERRLRGRFGLAFGGVGIVCHGFEPQVFKPPGRRNQVFRLTRNPVYAGWKRFEDKPAAIVEEARAHLEVSLAIEVLGDDLHPDDRPDLFDHLSDLLPAMRLAGGSIHPGSGRRCAPEWIPWSDAAADNAEAFGRLRRRLLPGFALVQRDDLLAARLAELRVDGEADALDALLDLSRLNVEPAGPDPGRPEQALWEVRRKPGWLVPIPVGYAALSPLHPPGSVRNSRDRETPFRFVESLYSLGAWVGPHRLTGLKQLLWHTDADPDAGLYLCVNRFPETLSTDTTTA